MILIIGGSNQGKRKYAEQKFAGYKCFDRLHLYIKKQLSQGQTEEDITKEILKGAEEKEILFISDEIGNGVVPIDAGDRQWREVTGRILIELADRADEVHLVVCGIGRRIK